MADPLPPPAEFPSSVPASSSPTPPPTSTPNQSHHDVSLTHLIFLTDSKVSRLNSILSTTAGLDTTLSTISYTLTLLSSTLPNITKLNLPIQSPPKPQRRPSPILSCLIKTTTSLRALADLIGDVRIFLRLWGLLGIWSWGTSVYRYPPKDRILRTIAWFQVGANAVYQALENGAYLSSHKILDLGGTKGGRREARWWIWSSRFWAAHVGLEFGRLGREWALRRKARIEQHPRSEEKGPPTKQEDVSLAYEQTGMMTSQRELERWWRDLAVNLAYAPLVVHWSLDQGLVGDGFVGALGSIAGVMGFREAWMRTSQM